MSLSITRLTIAMAAAAFLANYAEAYAQQGAGQMPPPAVSVMTVQPHTVPLTFQYAARISPYREIELHPQVGGILLERDFTEGSEVKAGEVLFKIDPASYQAAVQLAQAQLDQAQAQLRQAQREEQRAISLFDQKVGTEKSRDDAKSARELAEAGVAAATATLKTAQLNLSYTFVKAPVGGITSLDQVSVGSLLSPSSLLTKITQLDPVYVNFAFSDSDAVQVRRVRDEMKAKGQTPKLGVQISFGDGSHYDKTATVDFTSSVIDAGTGTLQSRAIVDNPDRRLLPGQFVRVNVTGVYVDNAITIPEVALMQGPTGQFVYTVGKDGNAKVSPVVLGQRSGNEWIVKSGLQAGETVITEGVIKVRPGAPVKPTADAAPAKKG